MQGLQNYHNSSASRGCNFYLKPVQLKLGSATPGRNIIGICMEMLSTRLVRWNLAKHCLKASNKSRRNYCSSHSSSKHQRPLALVTGGSRGIGKSISLALLKENYRVAILSKSDMCEKTALELSTLVGRPESAIGIRCDLEDLNSIPQAVKAVEERMGPIDVLVNNAGIAGDGLLMRTSNEDLQKVLTINLTSPIVFSREVSKSMLRRRASGNIIMIGSVIGEIGNVGQTAYAASKAGLIGATKSMAQELGSKKIRTNLIAPGLIKTDMTADLAKKLEGKSAMEFDISPEDVAATVLYLIRTESMNGQIVTLDSARPYFTVTG